MRVEPDPADLFPDVAAVGGLAAALRTAAEARGYALDVIQSGNDLLSAASVPSSATGREPLRVSGWRLSDVGRYPDPDVAAAPSPGG